MSNVRPKHFHYSISTTLSIILNDEQLIILQLPTDDQEYEVGNDSKRVIKRKLFLKRIWKRLRWVSVQCALLMFNFAQTEWVRASNTSILIFHHP